MAARRLSAVPKALKGDGARPSSSSGSSSSSSSNESVRSKMELRGDLGATPIVIVATPPEKKAKHKSPQAAIDEFWAKFNSKTPGRASTVLPKNLYAQQASKQAPKGTTQGHNAVASYDEAAKACKEKVAQIVRECRRVNQKYRDPHFDIEFDLKWGRMDCLKMITNDPDDYCTFDPESVKRVGDIFDAPVFFSEGATSNDIRQGRDGDCWLMSSLCALGNMPGLIEKVCVARDEKVGVYGFVFHRDGEWVSEIIDDKLYLTKPDYDESWIERNLIEDRQRINSEEDYRKIYQSNSGALYFAQCEDPNETWLPLLEKAYAKAHGDYAAIEGGFTGEAIEDLTGGITTEIFSSDILDKEHFWGELLRVNKDFLFGCAAGIFLGRGTRKGIYEGHAYSIMKAVEIDGQRLCLVRNPWGVGEWTGPWSDGSKEWTPEWMQKLDHRFGDDGAFWMSYDDLLKKYQTFDRTRLFTDDWKVTQQWTSISVPWTVSYLDTKFSFTVAKKAPVVIVLSQLDTRYFCGLEGEYSYELCFRVHKAGEEDYIVRSHGNYWMRRSVTAELELEAGEYHVLIKIEANRDTNILPVEDALKKNAKERRDKLMRVGLSYDMAHAKGQVIESPEERKARKAAEAKSTDKKKSDLKKKLMKEKKSRKHVTNREKRKIRAAKVKREAKQKAKDEKKKAEDAEKTKIAEAKEDPKPATKDEVKEVTKPEEAKEVAKETVTEAAKPEEAAIPVAFSSYSESLPSVPEAPVQTKQDTPPGAKVEVKVDPPPPTAPEVPGPPLLAGFSAGGDDDSESEIDSNVSDISDTEVADELEGLRLAEESAPPPPEEEEDEFERDPWNAIAVVGLRIYSREAVSIRVIRPTTWAITHEEGNLDVDDSAKDATEAVIEEAKKTAAAVTAKDKRLDEETSEKEGAQTERSDESAVLV